MRSKRVTKLLACVLSAAMCAGPTAVFASSEISTAAKGTIQGDFGLYSPEVKVEVPIKASVKVNPLSKNGVQTVKQFGLASKDLVIKNKTIDGTTATDREGVQLLVTVGGTITGKGENVKAFYEQNGFTANGASKEKNIYMQLAAANPNKVAAGSAANALSENNQYTLAADNQPYTQTMTSLGSRIQFSIPAPSGTSISSGTVSTGDQAYGAFAVIGNANTGADWVANDMTVELKYEIQASTADGIVSPTVANVTVTSTNGVSVNNFVRDSDLYGAQITKILLYDKTVDTPEVVWPVDSPSLTFTRNTADDGYDFKISKDDPTIQYLNDLPAGSSKRSGKYFLLVAFSDGRVSKCTVTVS